MQITCRLKKHHTNAILCFRFQRHFLKILHSFLTDSNKGANKCWKAREARAQVEKERDWRQRGQAIPHSVPLFSATAGSFYGRFNQNCFVFFQNSSVLTCKRKTVSPTLDFPSWKWTNNNDAGWRGFFLYKDNRILNEPITKQKPVLNGCKNYSPFVLP